MKWSKGTGLSAAYFIVSEDMRWQICKSGEPPIYTLIRVDMKPSQIIFTGALKDCKEMANEGI